MKSFRKQLMNYAQSIDFHLNGESSIAVLGITSSKKSNYSQKFKLLNINYKTNHDLINHHECLAFFDRYSVDLIACNRYVLHPTQFLTAYSIPYSEIVNWKISPTKDIDVLFKFGCMTILGNGSNANIDFVKHVSANNEYRGTFDEFNQYLMNINIDNNK